MPSNDIEARARRAMEHPDLRQILQCIPQAERDNPKALRHWLMLAADVAPDRFADSPAINEAFGLLYEVEAQRGLRDRIAAAYWDPKLRAKYGTEAIERAWNDPATAKQILLAESAAGKLTPEADAALNVLYEIEIAARDAGQALPGPAEAPLPSGAAAAEQEIAALRTKAVTGKLTTAEDARYNALLGARIDRETAAEAAPSPKSNTPTERQRLIEKSVSGSLSLEESDRLNGLIEATAIAEGLISVEDNVDE